VFQHPLSCVENPLKAEPPRIVVQKEKATPELIAHPLPEQQFYPRTKTSFTALSRHQLHAAMLQDDLVTLPELTESAADEIHLETEAEVLQQPLDWIKLNFPKGTVAGTFLHSIFEHLDFQDSSYWN